MRPRRKVLPMPGTTPESAALGDIQAMAENLADATNGILALGEIAAPCGMYVPHGEVADLDYPLMVVDAAARWLRVATESAAKREGGRHGGR